MKTIITMRDAELKIRIKVEKTESFYYAKWQGMGKGAKIHTTPKTYTTALGALRGVYYIIGAKT